MWSDATAVSVAVNGEPFNFLFLLPGLVATLALCLMHCVSREDVMDSTYSDEATMVGGAWVARGWVARGRVAGLMAGWEHGWARLWAFAVIGQPVALPPPPPPLLPPPPASPPILPPDALPADLQPSPHSPSAAPPPPPLSAPPRCAAA